MNDPHVVALLYRVNHDKSIDYSRVEPLIHKEPAFLVEIKDNQARFEMKEHYATEEDARHAIENYIRNWELNACLEQGTDSFRLEYERPEIEDRNPTPDIANDHVDVDFGTVSLGELTATLSVTVVTPNYPAPPSGVNFNDPDVQTMYQRYMGYRQGNEPLASMAYFCLTFLESSMRQTEISTRRPSKRRPLREKVAKEYKIEKSILAACRTWLPGLCLQIITQAFSSRHGVMTRN